jgi:hypothetical protein
VLNRHPKKLKSLGFIKLAIGDHIIVVVGLSLSDSLVDSFEGFFEPSRLQLDHNFIQSGLIERPGIKFLIRRVLEEFLHVVVEEIVKIVAEIMNVSLEI